MSTRTPVSTGPSAPAPLHAESTRHHRWLAHTLGALLGAAALVGCAVVPVGPAYGGAAYYDDGYVMATVAPPATYYEPVPVIPFVGAVWIGGFWDWSGGRHVWRPGHYEHPRPGFAYHQPGWHAGPNGQWMLHRGGWERGGWERGGPGRR